ncbi:conditioned medium-induced protein 4 [Halomarina litorea]|uniref:conditioned medium-induced protein 4 n=1 Tax=Halomarina litorea TaxID=2961595 RepID=UPI0020C37F45|nr:conditioned medium-induced protein 4 [Halomarina sp. BCD28]
MDEKTAELRDIFIDVTDGETVTEKQEEARGSLTENEEHVGTRVEDIVARMREQFDFESDLSNGDLRRVAEGYHDGETDAAIAEALDADPETVVTARHDLHLLHDRELEPPFELARLRELLNEDRTVADVAEELDASASTVRKYRAVVETRREMRSVNNRFVDEFAELLTDADLQDHTDEVKQDGLDEATEGMETNVSL